MRKYRMKIALCDYDELEKLVFADLPKEAGAFALAGINVTPETTDIIVRRHIRVPAHHFTVQREERLEISTQAINGLAALCEANQTGAILCHSHPRRIPYSSSDDHGEARIFKTLRSFIPKDAPTASILLYPGGVQARVWLPDNPRPQPVSEIIILDRSIKRIRLNSSRFGERDSRIDSQTFDRQIRAFGEHGQNLISNSKVGIVGIGGTGSPVAEQLVRLGIGDLKIIDPDDYHISNKTRVYGTFEKTGGRWRKKKVKKVNCVADHLREVNPQANIIAIPKNVVLEEGAVELLDRDVIFLCTDEHWGRSIVNQIAYQHFIPTLNLGVRIAAKDGKIGGAVGVLDVLRPDQPCLWCRQFLSGDRIAAESMPRKDRKERQREGYVEDLDSPTPSVISTTTTIAGFAVTQYLQLLTDFMGESGRISRLNYTITEGTVRRGAATIPEKCVCKKFRGLGQLQRLPTVPNLDFLEIK